MAFTDEDLQHLKAKVAEYGTDPGIDVCNYIDAPAEIASLLARLEAAEACIAVYEEGGRYFPSLNEAADVTDEIVKWLKSKGATHETRY